MEHRFHSFTLILFLLLFISSSTALARLLTTKEGERMKVDRITGGSHFGQEEDDSLNELMGLESCERDDEECLKRRILSEAHLDYIYTQQLNP